MTSPRSSIPDPSFFAGVGLIIGLLLRLTFG